MNTNEEIEEIAREAAEEIFNKPDFEPIRNKILTRKEFQHLAQPSILSAITKAREADRMFIEHIAAVCESSINGNSVNAGGLKKEIYAYLDSRAAPSSAEQQDGHSGQAVDKQQE